MSDRMEPPDATCPRCREYVNEEDRKYCQCGEELIYDEIYWIRKYDDADIMCPRCHKAVTDDTMKWRCSKCGFDGTIEECDGCRKELHPSNREGLCKECQLEAKIAQDEEAHEYASWKLDLEEED